MVSNKEPNKEPKMVSNEAPMQAETQMQYEVPQMPYMPYTSGICCPVLMNMGCPLLGGAASMYGANNMMGPMYAMQPMAGMPMAGQNPSMGWPMEGFNPYYGV